MNIIYRCIVVLAFVLLSNFNLTDIFCVAIAVFLLFVQSIVVNPALVFQSSFSKAFAVHVLIMINIYSNGILVLTWRYNWLRLLITKASCCSMEIFIHALKCDVQRVSNLATSSVVTHNIHYNTMSYPYHFSYFSYSPTMNSILETFSRYFIWKNCFFKIIKFCRIFFFFEKTNCSYTFFSI